jgi:hypothetical protein
MGQGFYMGRISRRDIRDQLFYFLKTLCNSTQVQNTFKKNVGEHRNGLAMICYELHPESIYSKTLDRTNLTDCRFIEDNNTLSKLISACN